MMSLKYEPASEPLHIRARISGRVFSFRNTILIFQIWAISRLGFMPEIVQSTLILGWYIFPHQIVHLHLSLAGGVDLEALAELGLLLPPRFQLLRHQIALFRSLMYVVR